MGMVYGLVFKELYITSKLLLVGAGGKRMGKDLWWRLMNSREAFEEWANKNNYDTTRTDTPISTKYKSPITQELFRAWQAAIRWHKEQPVEASSFLKELERKILRDKIAIAAMQGMLAHPTRYKPRPQDQHLHWHQALAKEACEITDAMLKDLA